MTLKQPRKELINKFGRSPDEGLGGYLDGEVEIRKLWQWITTHFEPKGKGEEMLGIKKIEVWGVKYRGNGYGPFMSLEMADDFAQFIPDRSERVLEGTSMSGIKAYIHRFDSLVDFIEISTLKSKNINKEGK